MELKSKLKVLVIDRGYNSLSDFSEQEGVSYYLLRRLANNKANTIDIEFIVQVCEILDCDISDLLYIERKGA